MARLARRWCRILGIDPDAAPPAPVDHQIPSELAEAIRRGHRGRSPPRSPPTSPRRPPFPPGKAAQRDAENAARSSAGKAAREVFGTEDPPRAPPRAPATPATTRPPPPAASPARCATPPPATRATTTVTSQLPPGRLRMRQALAADAQRAAGAVPDRRALHPHHPAAASPPRRCEVGIACDISGSMSAFTGPVASAAWILARAAAHHPRRATATVLYGERVHALTRPGQAPAQVTDFTAPDGTEKLCRAIDALDGALGLVPPRHRPPAGHRLRRRLRPRRAPPAASSASPASPAPAAASSSSAPHAPTPARRTWTDCQVTDLDDPADTIDAIARAATRALTA